MSLKIITTIIIINLIVFTEMNGQNQHTVTIEKQLLVSPSQFSLSIKCPSLNILYKPAMEGESFISKDSVIAILNTIEHVNITTNIEKVKDQSRNDYLDEMRVEVYGISALQELRTKLHLKAIVGVEIYHVDDFKNYESKLISKMLSEGQQIATEEISKHNKEVGEMLEYKELEVFGADSNETEIQKSNSGFSVLKEKYIAPTYDGHLINEKGQIVLKKKLQIVFEVK